MTIFSRHARERMEEREISKNQIIELITQWKNGKVQAINQLESICKLLNQSITVIIKTTSEEIITTYPTNSALSADEMTLWAQLYDEIYHPTHHSNSEESLLAFFNEKKSELKENFFRQGADASNIRNDENFDAYFRLKFLNYCDIIFLPNRNINYKPSLSLLNHCLITKNLMMLTILIHSYQVPLINDVDKSPLHKLLSSSMKLDVKQQKNVKESLDYLLTLCGEDSVFSNIVLQEKDFTKPLNRETIDKRPELHGPDRVYFYTLLHRALYRGYDEIAVWLIEKGKLDYCDRVDNLSRNDETISDLIRRNYHRLPRTINYLYDKKGICITKLNNTGTTQSMINEASGEEKSQSNTEDKINIEDFSCIGKSWCRGCSRIFRQGDPRLMEVCYHQRVVCGDEYELFVCLTCQESMAKTGNDFFCEGIFTKDFEHDLEELDE